MGLMPFDLSSKEKDALFRSSKLLVSIVGKGALNAWRPFCEDGTIREPHEMAALFEFALTGAWLTLKAS